MPFLLLFIALFSTAVIAEQQWFDRHSEGWFWYESILEPEREQNGPKIQTVKPHSLSTAWIRRNIGQYLDKAIDHPSKENVSNYLYLDRLVKEKAERFAHVGRQVIEADPMLDENVRRPISPAAAKVKDDMAYQAKELVLKKIAKKTGIIFYYQGRCKLCHLQAQSVYLLQNFYAFEVISFSVDGVLIPGLPDSRVDRSPHPKLNIRTYPALYLMQPPDNIELLRQGGISFTDLSERIIEVAAEHGWITKDELGKTRISTESWQNTESPLSHLFLD